MDSLNNPQRVQALLEEIESRNDYAHRSGVRMTNITPDLAEGILDATPDMYNPLGMVHGGCLYMFADTVAGVAVWALTGVSHVTMESSIHFLRPAKAGRLRAVAKPIKLGRQVCIYSVEIFGPDDKKVFYATLSFFTKESKSK